MPLDLTEEQALLVETVEKFAAERVVPHATLWSRESCVPAAVIEEVAALGLLGLELEPDAGGAGMGLQELALVAETLGAGDAGLAFGVLMHGIAGWACASAGHNVESLATGRSLASVGWGRPEALLAKTADASGWTLTGHVAGASWVETASCFVVRATLAAGGQGLFLVEREASGLAVASSPQQLGFRSATLGSLRFEDTSAVLLTEAEAEIAALQARVQLVLGALAVGLGHAAAEVGHRYAFDRKQFGKPIATFQAIQFKLVDMRTEVEAGRLLTWQAANAPDAPSAVAMARLFAGDAALRAANECLQIHGGYGFTEEFPAERLYRDAQIVKILAGSSQAQRLVVAREWGAE